MLKPFLSSSFDSRTTHLHFVGFHKGTPFTGTDRAGLFARCSCIGGSEIGIFLKHYCPLLNRLLTLRLHVRCCSDQPIVAPRLYTYYSCIIAQAAIMAACRPGDHVLVARNCHVSVFNGLITSGCKPLWILPEIDRGSNVAVGVTVAALRSGFHKARLRGLAPKAVVVVSPSYFGSCSDVSGETPDPRSLFCLGSAQKSRQDWLCAVQHDLPRHIKHRA